MTELSRYRACGCGERSLRDRPRCSRCNKQSLLAALLAAWVASPCADPAAPCPYPPGTAGKVECLAARVAAGLPLWHPLDARHAD
jgi:hypothetical protein